MKRLFILIAITFITFSTFAQTTTVTLGNESVCGTQITVPITVQNFSGVGAISVSIVWDTAELQYVSAQNHTALGNNGTGLLAGFGFESNGVYSYSWIDVFSGSLGGVYANDGDVLFDITFDIVSSPGMFDIEFSTNQGANEISDVLAQPYTTNFINGSAIFGAAPSINIQPLSQSVSSGDVVLFSVDALNVSSYQWQISVDGGNNWSDIVGEVTSVLSLTALGSMDGNQYRCVLSSPPCNDVVSSEVDLTVSAPVVVYMDPISTCDTLATVEVKTENMSGVGAISLSIEIPPCMQFVSAQNHTALGNNNTGLLGGFGFESNGVYSYSWIDMFSGALGGVYANDGDVLFDMILDLDEGCCQDLNWSTSQGANEIADLSAVPLTANFQDETICNQIPVVSITNFGTLCEGANPISLTGALPIGGSYSGTGVVGGNFFPAIAGVGVHTITYDYTSILGCTASTSSTIEVVALPSVSMGAISDVCLDASPVILTQGLPLGGSYSGTGVSGSAFVPSIAGEGSHIVTYTYADVNGCSATANTNISVNASPSVSLNISNTNVCYNDSPFPLLGGNPFGGTYTGAGVSTGFFSPVMSGLGPHTITYSYIDNNGCLGTADQQIIVLPSPNVSLSQIPDLCTTDNPLTLTGGSPSGGTYSGTGVSSGILNPSLAGAGSTVVTYTYSDSYGCTSSATTSSTVISTPNVSITSFSNVCSDSSPFSLSGGSPSGGTYSGTGVVSGSLFYPIISGVGSHIITYSYNDGSGCVGTASELLIVNETPIITLNTIDDLCVNDGLLDLDFGNPIGGVYSGQGVNANYFDPSIGDGTYSLTYSYTDANGCTSSDNQSITVNNITSIILNPFSDVCELDGVVQLNNGFPVTGIYSGIGVSNNEFNTLDAGVGSHQITYSYTNSLGCVSSLSENIVVNVSPTVNAGLDVVVYEGSSTVLNGIANANTSGNLSIAWSPDLTLSDPSLFNPTATPSQSTNYTLTATNNLGCSLSDQVLVTVIPPAAVFAGYNDTLCVDALPITLQGTPSGGLWSGLGVDAFGVFDPSVGAGIHSLTYTVTDSLGVISDSLQIVVNGLPTATLNSYDPPCSNDLPIMLKASTNNPLTWGTFSGSGVYTLSYVDFELDPAVTGAGLHTVSMSFTDINGCSNNTNFIIEVYDLPVVSIVSPGVFCEDSPAQILSAIPFGGSWGGDGITSPFSSLFSPLLVGAGTANVNYTYTDSVGCENSDTTQIVINGLPAISFLPIDTIYCEDAAAVTIVPFPFGGSWAGDGVDSLGVFTPSLANIGTNTLNYTATDINGCSNTSHIDMYINSLPNAGIAQAGPFCPGDAPETIIAIPGGGVFSGNGMSSGIFDPVNAGAGTHTITYDYTDVNGCSTTTTADFDVSGTPILMLTQPSDFCLDDASEIFTADPVGGTWSGLGIDSIGNFNPAIAGVGSFVITYDYVNNFGCFFSENIDVGVNSLPSVSVSPSGPYCYEDSDVSLLGFPTDPDGTWNWSGVGITDPLLGVFSPSDLLTIGTNPITYSYTDVNSCSSSAILDIVVYELPMVSIDPIGPFCLGDAIPVQLTGTPSIGTWSGNGVDAVGVFDPELTGAGIHTVQYTAADSNGTGCTAIALFDLVVYESPIVNAGLDIDICLGDTALLVATGGDNYSWSTGEFVDSIFVSPLITTTYLVDVTDINGCTGFDDIVVAVNPLPIADAGLDIDICEGDTALLVATGGNNYSWSTGDLISQISISLIDTTIFWVEVEAFGCIGFDTVKVSTIPLPPAPTITLNWEDQHLDAYSADLEIQWYQNGALLPGANSYTYSPAMTDVYSATYYDSLTGCTSLPSSEVLYNVNIDEINELDFQIYPNPTKGDLAISFNAQNENFELSIFDITGKLVNYKTGNSVLGKNVIQFNLEQEKQGVYFIKLLLGDKFSSRKILLNR